VTVTAQYQSYVSSYYITCNRQNEMLVKKEKERKKKERKKERNKETKKERKKERKKEKSQNNKLFLS
jgi:hypothetical protein